MKILYNDKEKREEINMAQISLDDEIKRNTERRIALF